MKVAELIDYVASEAGVPETAAKKAVEARVHWHSQCHEGYCSPLPLFDRPAFRFNSQHPESERCLRVLVRQKQECRENRVERQRTTS
jgi:hypothetical protein